MEKKTTSTTPTEKYVYALGRRKEATAQVRLFPQGTGKLTINERDLSVYFPLYIHQQTVLAPFVTTGNDKKMNVDVKVQGGGVHGQADSIRLGIARALVAFNPEYRSSLKKLGFLTRDARVRERKKYGKKSARRSPQWSKR